MDRRLSGVDRHADATSPDGRKTITTYVPMSERVASVQVGEPAGDVTLFPAEYTYVTTPGVNAGKLATVTVGGVGGRVTTYTYDPAGNLTSVAAPTGTTEYTAWDALGRPTSMALPGGRVVTQTYDALGAPKLVTPPGNGAGSSNVHELGYTPARRLASYVAPDVTPPTPPMSLASRTTAYAYDRDDLLTSVTSPVAALSPVLTRDLAGRVTPVTEGARQRDFAYAAGHVTGGTSTSTRGATR